MSFHAMGFTIYAEVIGLRQP